jgi:hypothetical protein
MNMKTIKVSEATGPALDWLVAKCQGFAPFTDGISWIVHDAGTYKLLPEYSTDPAQAYPIIDREEISTLHTGDAAKWKAHVWDDKREDFWPVMYGPTTLIAAMRCRVVSKLGETVEVPEALVCPNT